MGEATNETLSRLQIAPEKKDRRRSGPKVILAMVVLLLAGAVVMFLATRKADREPIQTGRSAGAAASAGGAGAAGGMAESGPAVKPKAGEPVLTVSGYVIPRERIEISPKFQGTVKWIGVKKGDEVKKGEVMVLLEDDEYRAHVMESEGRVALAVANLTNA